SHLLLNITIHNPGAMNAWIGIMDRNPVVFRTPRPNQFPNSPSSQLFKALLHIHAALTQAQVGIEGRILPEDVGTGVGAFKKVGIEIKENVLAENSVPGTTRDFQIRIKRAVKVELVASSVGI